MNQLWEEIQMFATADTIEQATLYCQWLNPSNGKEMPQPDANTPNPITIAINAAAPDNVFVSPSLLRLIAAEVAPMMPAYTPMAATVPKTNMRI